MNLEFYSEAFMQMLSGVPLTLQLAASSIVFGAILALLFAMMRLSGVAVLDWIARFLWPILREPYWCAIIALTLNNAAYASEIIRGGLLSVPSGQIEAAKACGMSRFTCFRRIVMPLAIRQALPGYGNEMISMVKATSLASIITLMEVTGIAAKLIAETYRAIEVFVIAGAIYLAINFVLTRALMFAEYKLTPYLRQPVVKITTEGKTS